MHQSNAKKPLLRFPMKNSHFHWHVFPLMGPGEQQIIPIFLIKFITCAAPDMSEGYAGLTWSTSDPQRVSSGPGLVSELTLCRFMLEHVPLPSEQERLPCTLTDCLTQINYELLVARFLELQQYHPRHPNCGTGWKPLKNCFFFFLKLFSSFKNKWNPDFANKQMNPRLQKFLSY